MMTDAQPFIKEHRVSRFQWLVFAMSFGIILLDGFDTGAIGFIAPSLLTEWDLQRAALAPVLSAALLGIAFGAFLTGPIADRLGRRGPIIVSTLIFGLAAFGSAFARDLMELTILRFLTGVGLGAALPNAVTIVSEFSPESRRSTLTNLMNCAFPLGTAFGGFLAAWFIPHFGWRSVLMVGGGAPLLLSVWLYAMMPESVRFMVAKGYPSNKIRAVLKNVAPKSLDVRAEAPDIHASTQPQHGGIRIVLSRTHLVGTSMLWIAFFMGLLIIYGVVNWMPVLLRSAGLDPAHATLISTLFPLGGFGAILSGVLMDRFNATRVIAVGYALTAVCIYLIGQAVGNVGLLVVTVFAAGILMNTSQASMPTLAAGYYPTAGRSTGVAWMLGIGRFGGIAGSFLVAELTSLNLSFAAIFFVMAIAGAISCAALLVMQSLRPSPVLANVGPDKSLALKS
jgi:AAHS family 4-hydroxybenzoate transporter-like MFS transporter